MITNAARIENPVSKPQAFPKKAQCYLNPKLSLNIYNSIIGIL